MTLFPAARLTLLTNLKWQYIGGGTARWEKKLPRRPQPGPTFSIKVVSIAAAGTRPRSCRRPWSKLAKLAKQYADKDLRYLQLSVVVVVEVVAVLQVVEVGRRANTTTIILSLQSVTSDRFLTMKQQQPTYYLTWRLHCSFI